LICKTLSIILLGVFLEQFLQLQAQPRPVEEGFPFLGFVLYPATRRLKRKKGIYYQRKLCSLLEQYASGDLPLETVTASVQGWVNHARYGNTVGLRKAILGGVIPPREE
jgi:hypothetical protein